MQLSILIMIIIHYNLLNKHCFFKGKQNDAEASDLSTVYIIEPAMHISAIWGWVYLCHHFTHLMYGIRELVDPIVSWLEHWYKGDSVVSFSLMGIISNQEYMWVPKDCQGSPAGGKGNLEWTTSTRKSCWRRRKAPLMYPCKMDFGIPRNSQDYPRNS